MSCGSWCVYYTSKGVSGACTNCSDYIRGRPSKFGLEKIDIFKLAEGLAKKKEKERRDKVPKLSVCPSCNEKSLFYNSTEDEFECLNLKCKLSKEV